MAGSEIGPKSDRDWEIKSAADCLIRASAIKKGNEGR